MYKEIISTCTKILALMAIVVSLNGQHALKGLVKNESGEVLKYASVFLNDNLTAVITDHRGVFEMPKIKTGDYTLKITYLGYEAYEIPVSIPQTSYINVVMKGGIYNLDALELISSRVGADHPIAHTNIDRTMIEKNDFSQDIPSILEHTPSVVMTSDAGNGVGYTSMKIRGFDATRINVTLNGVPFNDAESQDVFFVDIPDILSSTEDIQIQRGVGSSTNGPAAFGASVSINTKQTPINPFINVTMGYGSYNTQRMSGTVGTGLMNGKYAVDFRYSVIKSDGYMDRASSDLTSYYLSVSKIKENSSLRFISFSGNERTYQAWNGVPKEKLYGTTEELQAHYDRNVGSIYKSVGDSLNLFNSDRKYNVYEYKDQVDDYNQTHYQLHYAKDWSEKWRSKSALYYTIGNGYYEQFKSKSKFKDYDLENPLDSEGNEIKRGDIVRRKILRNSLVGAFIHLDYSINNSNTMQFGIAGSTYKGLHFGKVLMAEFIPDVDVDDDYYINDGYKKEASIFAKYNTTLFNKLKLFLDVQARTLNYETYGINDDLVNFDIDKSYLFINPKIGFNYKLNNKSALNLFFGMSNREPDRNDFTEADAGETPKHEQIQDFEFSYKWNTSYFRFEANAYYMNYKDQLVLRGDLNDVGAAIRVNVDKSFRRGLELSTSAQFFSRLKGNLNFTFSQNKIDLFDELVIDYATGTYEVTTHKDTDISLSPEVISNVSLTYDLLDLLDLTWNTRFVSEQYIDNTSNSDRSIPSYSVSDFLVSYEYNSPLLKSVSVGLKLSNVFNNFYASKAYTYSYIYGDKITESFYFPQAERNFNLIIRIKL